MHHELPDDPYLPNAYGRTKTSPGYKDRNEFYFTTQVNVNELGENILGDAANEPSIAIDATNPNRMIIGWRQFDNVSSNFRQAGIGYTDDGGETWTFPQSIDEGVFRSDPVLDSDANGNIFYNSLTVDYGDEYTCDVYKIAAEGFTWDEGTDAQGGDKQWMVVDKTGGIGDGNIYSFWTSYWSICYPGFFTRSTNGNTSYDNCVEIPGDPSWGTMAVGPEGEVFVIGEGYDEEIIVSKSVDANNSGNPVSWGIYSEVDLDGYLNAWAAINPSGLVGQANIGVDVSGGPGHGNVYALASVQRSSNYDPADIMFARSTSGGMFWEDPIRINDDASSDNYQWFGVMAVAPNGRIDVAWLDTRNANAGSLWSQLFYACSIDQGDTWSQNYALSDSFDPHAGWPNQEKMGDYFDMESDDVSAHLAWASTLNGEQDVYYARISPLVTSLQNKAMRENPLLVSCVPNPSKGRTNIRFSAPENAQFQITLSDIYGKELKVLKNGWVQAEQNSLEFDTSDYPSGFYFCTLKSGIWTKTVKIAVM